MAKSKEREVINEKETRILCWVELERMEKCSCFCGIDRGVVCANSGREKLCTSKKGNRRLCKGGVERHVGWNSSYDSGSSIKRDVRFAATIAGKDKRRS